MNPKSLKEAIEILTRCRNVCDHVEVKGRNNCFAIAAIADDLMRVIQCLGEINAQGEAVEQ